MAIFGDFLRPAFLASRVQHVLDLHLEFALRPQQCASMADIHSATDEIRRGKKEEEEIRTNDRMKIQWSALFHRATITIGHRLCLVRYHSIDNITILIFKRSGWHVNEGAHSCTRAHVYPRYLWIEPFCLQ